MTTPNARVILPAEATGIMKEKGSTWVDGSLDRTHEAYRAMLAASPNSGRVTAEMLEAAARAICFSDGQTDWPLDEGDRSDFRRMARAAISALGLEVEG